jgi:hypothetical protein
MSLELSPNYEVRSRGHRGNGLSVLTTLIAPLFAVVLSHYLSTQEKHQTTFALPIQDTYTVSQEAQHLEPDAQLSTAKDSPSDHVQLWQAFPLLSEKQALAKKLLGSVSETKDDPASQFVLLQLAKDIAAQANDGQTAFQAIDTMAETFQVDADTMKMAVLTKFASTAQKPAQHKFIAEQALKLAEQAISEDHFMVSSQLDKLAITEASKALDKELLTQALGQIAEVADLIKARESRLKRFPSSTD